MAVFTAQSTGFPATDRNVVFDQTDFPLPTKMDGGTSAWVWIGRFMLHDETARESPPGSPVYSSFTFMEMPDVLLVLLDPDDPDDFGVSFRLFSGGGVQQVRINTGQSAADMVGKWTYIAFGYDPDAGASGQPFAMIGCEDVFSVVKSQRNTATYDTTLGGDWGIGEIASSAMFPGIVQSLTFRDHAITTADLQAIIDDKRPHAPIVLDTTGSGGSMNGETGHLITLCLPLSTGNTDANAVETGKDDDVASDNFFGIYDNNEHATADDLDEWNTIIPCTPALMTHNDGVDSVSLAWSGGADATLDPSRWTEDDLPARGVVSYPALKTFLGPRLAAIMHQEYNAVGNVRIALHANSRGMRNRSAPGVVVRDASDTTYGERWLENWASGFQQLFAEDNRLNGDCFVPPYEPNNRNLYFGFNGLRDKPYVANTSGNIVKHPDDAAGNDSNWARAGFGAGANAQGPGKPLLVGTETISWAVHPEDIPPDVPRTISVYVLEHYGKYLQSIDFQLGFNDGPGRTDGAPTAFGDTVTLDLTDSEQYTEYTSSDWTSIATPAANQIRLNEVGSGLDPHLVGGQGCMVHIYNTTDQEGDIGVVTDVQIIPNGLSVDYILTFSHDLVLTNIDDDCSICLSMWDVKRIDLRLDGSEDRTAGDFTHVIVEASETLSEPTFISILGLGVERHDRAGAVVCGIGWSGNGWQNQTDNFFTGFLAKFARAVRLDVFMTAIASQDDGGGSATEGLVTMVAEIRDGAGDGCEVVCLGDPTHFSDSTLAATDHDSIHTFFQNNAAANNWGVDDHLEDPFFGDAWKQIRGAAGLRSDGSHPGPVWFYNFASRCRTNLKAAALGRLPLRNRVGPGYRRRDMKMRQFAAH